MEELDVIAPFEYDLSFPKFISKVMLSSEGSSDKESTRTYRGCACRYRLPPKCRLITLFQPHNASSFLSTYNNLSFSS